MWCSASTCLEYLNLLQVTVRQLDGVFPPIEQIAEKTFTIFPSAALSTTVVRHLTCKSIPSQLAQPLWPAGQTYLQHTFNLKLSCAQDPMETGSMDPHALHQHRG